MVQGRFLAGLLFILALFQQSSAETIPFDYWYGRIVGRTQIQAVHDAYNGQYGVLTTSMKVDHGNDVSVNLGTLFDISEASQSNALLLSPRRPVLSANVALGPRLRWQIDRLDWQEDATHSSDDFEDRFRQQSEFLTDQSVMMLRHDIEYDSTRSLYYYTQGMFLQPGNWRLDVQIQSYINDDSEARASLRRLPHSADSAIVRRTTENDKRLWAVDAGFACGISQRLQLQVDWKVGRQSNPSNWLEELRTMTEADSLLQRNHQRGETLNHVYELSLGSRCLLSDHHWASLRPYFRSNLSTLRRETIGTSSLNEILHGSETDRTYGLALDHSLIIGSHSISRAQLLDDCGDYYRHRFKPGSFNISTSADLSYRRESADRWGEFENGERYALTQHKFRQDGFRASTEATYYSRYNLDFSMKLSVNCSSYGSAADTAIADYTHGGSHYLTLSLGYYSYRWDPAQRSEISWDWISDIDYIYGPLLRPRDFRASISLIPPANEWSYADRSESVFNFFKGESNNLWALYIASAFGLCEGIEAGLAANYVQYSPPANTGSGFWQKMQQDHWTVQPSFRWQPGSRFRVDFTLLERYDDYDSVVQYEEVKTHEHSYEHSWEIIVKYNILI